MEATYAIFLGRTYGANKKRCGFPSVAQITDGFKALRDSRITKWKYLGLYLHVKVRIRGPVAIG